MRQILDLMAIIGFPTLFACIVGVARMLVKFGQQMRILMDAQQKQMRRDLTQDYHEYMTAGYISDDDLDLWEAGYQAYHKLNQNGIMDSRREDLIKLNSKAVAE